MQRSILTLSTKKNRGRIRGGQRWVDEHRKDRFVKQAKAQGLRSRAVFKLEEIIRRDRLLAKARLVVDLGSAPGGWSQWCEQQLRDRGEVIALDLLPMVQLPGVHFIQGDFRSKDVRMQLYEILADRKADLVISDMAPNLTGMASVDQARALDLAETAFEFCLQTLSRNGNFVVKLFEGEESAQFRRRCRQYFRECVVRKPAASRPRSREIYLLCKGLRVLAGTGTGKGTCTLNGNIGQ
ncbi:MAG TPA: RlmE family RNA methyltransferase [Gammaproteobacteria bacterium]|nr:RlmE family RNA methyltransferase [Gammaproteobacteria bacterium]